VAHVLSRFSVEEAKLLPDVVARAADMVELWIRSDLITTMNEANRRPEAESEIEDAPEPEAL